MQPALYDVSIPVMIAGLRHTAAFLELGRRHADQAGIDHAAMLGARLFPDMMSLTQQVQRASDTAKGTAVRLGGLANVAMPDTEQTFDEVQQRIAATIALLETVSPSVFNEHADTEVVLPIPSGPRTYTGRSYILEFALPNFFFHVTTAYNLLRSQGVPLGKRHFLGWE